MPATCRRENLSRLAAALLALFTVSAGAGDLKFKTELALGYDSNVANARHGAVEREAGFALLNSGAEKFWQLGSFDALQARLNVEAQAYARYEKLDSARGTLTLRYHLRPGAGFYVPTLALGGSAAWSEFNSGLRDSAEYRATALLLEQLTTRIGVRISGSGNWRRARGEVFDLNTRSLGIDLDWVITNRAAMYLGYQRRRGDFVTTRPTPPPTPAVFAPDDAFPGEYALRQDGSADIGTLGFNFALSPRWGIDVQGLYVDAASKSGIAYRRLQTTVSLLARF